MEHIQLTVQGSRVAVAAGDPCVAGEGNSTGLRLTFDGGWDGLAKTAVFWDATGANPVRRILTADLLECPDRDTRTYVVPIPAEPLAVAGRFTLVLDGAGEGVRRRTLPVELEVAEVPDGDAAADPADPTLTQAEQLQGQIDTVLDSVAEAIAAGEQAARSAHSAQQAAQSAHSAQQAAQTAADAQAAAADHEAAAKDAAEEAEGYTSHPPIIGDNGSWLEWDGQAYVDTGLPSRGEYGQKGDKGDTGAQGPQGVPGLQGEKGDIGPAGADGYTPRRGEDYFTPEDVAQIVADTRAQIAASEKYELIETITTTEEVSEIRRTLKPDGTAYALKKLILGLYVPVAAGNSPVRVADTEAGNICYLASMIRSTAETYAKAFLDMSGGLSLVATQSATGKNNPSGLDFISPSMFKQMSVVSGVRIYANTVGVVFPTGTKIDIYGVRA